jgi:hypothetical protein
VGQDDNTDWAGYYAWSSGREPRPRLQILRLDETERDGQAYSGPKHWHTFDILARNPGQ